MSFLSSHASPHGRIDANAMAYIAVGISNLVLTVMFYMLGRASIANSTAALYFDGVASDVHEDDLDVEYDQHGRYDVYQANSEALAAPSTSRRIPSSYRRRLSAEAYGRFGHEER